MSILYDDAIRIASIKVSGKIQPSKVRCLQRSKRKCNHTPHTPLRSQVALRGRPGTEAIKVDLRILRQIYYRSTCVGAGRVGKTWLMEEATVIKLVSQFLDEHGFQLTLQALQEERYKHVSIN